MAFSFGSSASKPAAGGGFSFGGGAAATPAASSTPAGGGFSFGGGASATPAASTPSGGGGFSFGGGGAAGGGAPATGAASTTGGTGGFSFGGGGASATSTPAAGGGGGFSFGGGGGGATTGAASKPAGASSGEFSLGGNAASSKPAAFKLGAPASGAAATPTFGSTAAAKPAGNASFTAPAPVSGGATPAFGAAAPAAASTPSFGAPSSTAKPAFGATPAAGGATGAAPAAGGSTPAAGNSQTDQATAAAARALLKQRSVEQLVNEWSAELEDKVGRFTQQALQVAKWDRQVMENGQKIFELHKEVRKTELAQDELERSLEVIGSQQNELHALLCALEAEVAKQDVGGGVMTAADQERARGYELAEEVNAQLDNLSVSLEDLVARLNATANVASDREQPVNTIVRILNDHLHSLQWIEQKTTQLSSRVNDCAQVVGSFDYRPV